MATPSSDTLSVFCNEGISEVPQEDIVTLGKKGSATVNKTAKKEEVKCLLRKDNMSTRNAEKDGALNTTSRLQKAKNRIDTPSPCKLISQNKKTEISQIAFSVVNQISVMAGDGPMTSFQSKQLHLRRQ